MNRIAGILSFDQTPVVPIELDRMIGAMKFQGQDGQSTWVQGGVGLGCVQIGGTQRSHTQGLIFGFPTERWVISFDGRIDNRQELLEVLKIQTAAGFSSIFDEELVLAAYEKWGLDFLKHLIGDFALALWDKKENRLVCARDHFGVKPFYYSLSRKSFLFASTPLALLASRKVPFLINEERIADHLVNPLEGVDKTSSFYREVLRLAPAHMLIVQAGELTVRHYWELMPAVHTGFQTENDYIEAFKELFAEAVRCRLQDVSTSACMLSGGMDSSSIVCMGRKIRLEEGGNPLHALAVISNSIEKNRETFHIFSVLNQGSLRSHLISEAKLLRRMDELVKAIETESEPFDCLMNLNRSVYLHARDEGMNALLDGIDGDVLLSGSGQLVQLWREGDFRTILGETFKAEGLTAEYKMGRSLFLNSLLSAYLPFAPDWLRTMRQPLRTRKVVASAVKESIIDCEFAIRSNLGERFTRLDSHRTRPSSFSQMEFHKLALDHPFLTVGLERYERVASAFGIEARHPFADIRLAEFCLGLPWQLKTQRGWTKFILRRAMESYLPAEVIWRCDKDSLMWEFNRLILKERADYFHQATLNEQEYLKPYIDMHKLEKFWREYLTLGNEKHAEMLWSGAALAFWLRNQRNFEASLK